MDIETDNIMANFNLVDINKSIYETRPSTKHKTEAKFLYNNQNGWFCTFTVKNHGQKFLWPSQLKLQNTSTASL